MSDGIVSAAGNIDDKLKVFYDKIANKTLSDILNISNVNLTSFQYKINKSFSLFNILKGVTELYCYDNDITELPAPKYLPVLTILDCSYNNIVEIPEYQNLIELNCSHNKIQKMGPLLKIKTMECSNNSLVRLPEMHAIESIYCSRNKLIELADYPTLKECYCDHNEIKLIKNLNNLEKIDCGSNSLKHFNILPKLKILNMADNKIKSLNDATFKSIEKITASYYYLLFLSKRFSKRIKLFKYSISHERFELYYPKFMKKIGIHDLYIKYKEQEKNQPKIHWDTKKGEAVVEWIDKAIKKDNALIDFFDIIHQCFKNCYIFDVKIMAKQLTEYLTAFHSKNQHYYLTDNGKIFSTLNKINLEKFICEIYLRLVTIEIICK